MLVSPHASARVQPDADIDIGVWPFHCHVAWHISEGMNINFLEKPQVVKEEMQLPGIMAQTCESSNVRPSTVRC